MALLTAWQEGTLVPPGAAAAVSATGTAGARSGDAARDAGARRNDVPASAAWFRLPGWFPTFGALTGKSAEAAASFERLDRIWYSTGTRGTSAELAAPFERPDRISAAAGVAGKSKNTRHAGKSRSRAARKPEPRSEEECAARARPLAHKVVRRPPAFAAVQCRPASNSLLPPPPFAVGRARSGHRFSCGFQKTASGRIGFRACISLRCLN